MSARKQPVRDPAATKAHLLDAAEAEFNECGFEGTDSNRIARRAGYAPQTFYRHFKDKKAAFLAVYERWWQAEADALERALARRGRPASALDVARIVIGFHTKWRGFRRSLRHLAIVDPDVRAARTAARREQIARMTAVSGRGDLSAAERAAALLKAERFCDAAADGEFADLGLPQKAVVALVAEAMALLVSRRPA
jgi:AcrR family transcriptional regulator